MSEKWGRWASYIRTTSYNKAVENRPQWASVHVWRLPTQVIHVSFRFLRIICSLFDREPSNMSTVELSKESMLDTSDFSLSFQSKLSYVASQSDLVFVDFWSLLNFSIFSPYTHWCMQLPIRTMLSQNLKMPSKNLARELNQSWSRQTFEFCIRCIR